MTFLMEEIVLSTSLVSEGESSKFTSFMRSLTLCPSGSIAIFTGGSGGGGSGGGGGGGDGEGNEIQLQGKERREKGKRDKECFLRLKGRAMRENYY